MNRLKNGLLLFILISFLCFVAIMSVDCIFKSVTGIYCSACGMTRAFLCILHFDFLGAFFQNILSIPLFVFLIFSIFMLFIDFFKNRFVFVPRVLLFLNSHPFFIISLLVISFAFNNVKYIF